MRSVGVILIVLVWVAGIAVNGSRAQPLPMASTAFKQCSAITAAGHSDQCQPLGVAVIAQTEFEMAGIDGAGAGAGEAAGAGAVGVAAGAEVGDSRGPWLGVFVFAWEVARYFLDNRYFPGGSNPGRPPVVIATVFDPVR